MYDQLLFKLSHDVPLTKQRSQSVIGWDCQQEVRFLQASRGGALEWQLEFQRAVAPEPMPAACITATMHTQAGLQAASEELSEV